MKFRKNRKLWTYYYPILFFTYTLALFSNKVSFGLVAGILMLIIAFKNIRIGRIGIMDMLIFFYVVYSTMSIMWFQKTELPINVFVTACSYSILPVTFYFCGKKEEDDKFLKNTIYAIIYSLLLGIVLYITAPQFYGDYLVYHSDASKNGIGWIQQALQSFYGVTATGTFSTIIEVYAFMEFMKNKSIKYILIMALGVVSLYLSYRRSSWLAIMVIVVYLHYLLYIKWKKLNIFNFIVEIIILGIVCVVINMFFYENLYFVIQIINTFSNAIGERSDNWSSGLSNVSNILIGDGLGSFGHLANLYGKVGVYDSTYINVLCELGIIGVIFLFFIIIITLTNAIKNTKHLYMEISIIILYLIQSIGSNIFEFQVLMPLFWYAIGKCFGKKENIR